MNLEPETSMSIVNEDGRSVYRLELVWTEETLAKAAREIAGKIDENVLARLGYEKRGRCIDIEDDPNDFCCSACGSRMFIKTNDSYVMLLADDEDILTEPNYCPVCGRKVVDS